MAFRPDTKYYIGSKEYDTIYEAFDAVRTMAKGTVIKDKKWDHCIYKGQQF